ncbi:hypothetical protein L210DRAFT_3509133 [Boletus edulis BED1]|uniref:C2H2-type domain-containing protein n=1 Tax=Boletus edulis BED1 TaxID=1328754 RepID=A0AAD4BFM8_BOLED|nr:hypothetical protein L210DRAFT_3509234 [Boletus edulis BED1]KAF8426482.1 hypothetical protein L210DRAFT_3509133 [Boletus edulis BED1]
MPKSHPCESCCESFPNKTSLRRHRFNRRTTPSPFEKGGKVHQVVHKHGRLECPFGLCSKNYINRGDFQTHLRKVHAAEVKVSEDTPGPGTDETFRGGAGALEFPVLFSSAMEGAEATERIEAIRGQGVGGVLRVARDVVRSEGLGEASTASRAVHGVAQTDQMMPGGWCLPWFVRKGDQTVETAELPEHEGGQAAIGSLRWCVAKVKALQHMLARSSPQKANGPVPFVSRSAYAHMATHLERIGQPLKEARRSRNASYRAFGLPFRMRDAHDFYAPHIWGGCFLSTVGSTKSPPSFIHTWKKAPRVSTGRSTVTTRALISATTWEWTDLPRNNFSRVMRTLAAAAIAESSAISSYRPEIILCHERGGAASLRLRVQGAVASLLKAKDPGQTSEMSLKDLFGSASQGSKGGTGAVLTEGLLLASHGR